MCRDTEQLLRFLASHDIVLGEFRCECCGLNLNKCRVICMQFFGCWFFTIA